MEKISYIIKSENGIHARPAGILVKKAGMFESDIKIELRDKSANAKKIFSVMGLGAKCNDCVFITAEGTDEKEAIKEMEEFFRCNL